MKSELSEYVKPGSAEERLLEKVDFERLPRHVAIIMDGNGRWAAERHRPRIFGHREGIRSVREVVEACARMGIEVLTLYAFSKENWKRPPREVSLLMTLLREFLQSELKLLGKHDIRLQGIGSLGDLPEAVQQDLAAAAAATSNNGGMVFNLALSYGSRAEIVAAVKELMAETLAKGEAVDLDEESFAERLTTRGLPDPDLLIRSSGEMRLSNFLLWQSAYAELWVTDTLWPDFRRQHLFEAILDFQARDRRYGGVDPASPPQS